MITKEEAMTLYNLYAQIETTEGIINDLEKFVKEQGEKVPDVIDRNYNQFGSIEISIPYFQGGKFENKGARVYNISYNAALRVLKNHANRLKKEVKMLNERLLKG